MPAKGTTKLISEADKSDAYARKKAAMTERNRIQTRAGQDIGEIPPVKNQARRDDSIASFRVFCETYYADQFSRAWSRDHLKVIAKIERAAVKGGLFAVAMPRGSGKTTLSEKACIWAILRGSRRFILLFAVNQDAANDILDNIKVDIEHNDLLAADFPEVCIPIRKIEGKSILCGGQRYKGERTHLGWDKEELTFPTIPGSVSSGAIIRSKGLSGRIRGMKVTRPVDGATMRPDLVVIDDPQTDETAISPSQVRAQMKLLRGAVLGLAEPGKKISGIMPCTVIARGDTADQCLDNDRMPEWQGERCKLLYELPERLDLWDKYNEIRKDSVRRFGDINLATEFYVANREIMDAGSQLMWPERYEEDEISALQYAMNLYYIDRTTFYAEYQNDPEGAAENDLALTDPLIIAERLNRLDRGIVPLATTKITAMIDVQHSLLYWAVVAWSEDFSGSVIDYGCWPQQPRSYFSLKQADPLLSNKYPGRSVKAAVFAGLQECTDWLLERNWDRVDQTPMKINRCLVDGKDQEVAEEIYSVCRTSSFAAILNPCGGKGIGPGDMPMMAYNIKEGERLGQNWLMKRSAKHALNHFLIDTHNWKTFIHDRIEVAVGDSSALSFFGSKGKADHRMIADHLVSEYRDRQFSDKTQRKVTVWKQKVGRPDNHLFDCLCGAAVAASIEGIKLPGAPEPKQKNRERISFSEMQRRRNGRG